MLNVFERMGLYRSGCWTTGDPAAAGNRLPFSEAVDLIAPPLEDGRAYTDAEWAAHREERAATQATLREMIPGGSLTVGGRRFYRLA